MNDIDLHIVKSLFIITNINSLHKLLNDLRIIFKLYFRIIPKNKMADRMIGAQKKKWAGKSDEHGTFLFNGFIHNLS
jgi:hypothetical protein